MKTLCIVAATVLWTIIAGACLLAWLMNREFPPLFVASVSASSGLAGLFLGAMLERES